MDSDQIYFDEIKREVLPDGRIRYYAEKIVTEIDIPMPRSQSDIDRRFSASALRMRDDIIKHIRDNDPYMKLLEGSVMATNRS